jgi:hypothetical protein
MQEESLEKEKASKLAFLLRENKELQSELSLLMQQQLGAQCTCFTSFTVAGEQGAPERAVAPDAAAARCSVCLLYWYKSANTDT